MPMPLEMPMNHLTSLFATLTITGGLMVSGYSQSFLTDGLVAYYPFNGSANDASGHGNDGSPLNVIYSTNRFGMQSSAVQFSGQLGTNSAINCPTLNALPYFPITYSCWFRLDGFAVADGEVMTLVGREQSDLPLTEGAIALMTLQRSGFTNEITYFTPDSFHFNRFRPATNQWYHTVLTIDSGALMSLFVNGSLYGTVQRTPSDLTGTVPLPFRIGGSTYNPQTNPNGNPSYPRYSWCGSIDDVRIYNRVLSTNEVKQLYTYEVIPCLPHRATAIATLASGFVVGATITDGGCGYTNAPFVQIQGGGGTGAMATAVVSNGVVASIVITDAGIGYTSTPVIYIYAPAGAEQVGLLKAVEPVFSDLLIGVNYQLQTSGDLNTWTNQGAAFTATNATMVYPQYWHVDNWGQLYFRLQVAP
jgi:hypothetical protein